MIPMSTIVYANSASYVTIGSSPSVFSNSRGQKVPALRPSWKRGRSACRCDMPRGFILSEIAGAVKRVPPAGGNSRAHRHAVRPVPFCLYPAAAHAAVFYSRSRCRQMKCQLSRHISASVSCAVKPSTSFALVVSAQHEAISPGRRGAMTYGSGCPQALENA